MAVKVYKSLDQFWAQFRVYDTATRKEQADAIRKSQARVDRALDAAASRITKGRGRLSGVGKTGARIGHRSVQAPSVAEGIRVTFKPIGPWQLKDNTLKGGPTKAHLITVNEKRTPRPTSAAKKYMPSMKTATGRYITNYSRTPGGPFAVVEHKGSSRQPAWGNAIESVVPRVISEHTAAFGRAADRAFK